MFIQARHWIVDDHDLFRQAGVLIERGEEEGQGKGVSIAGAERVLERGTTIGAQRDRNVVDEDAIAGGRPAAIIHRRDRAESKARVEAAQIVVDRGLVCGEDTLPILVESGTCIIP
jgi:hypothetical protein